MRHLITVVKPGLDLGIYSARIVIDLPGYGMDSAGVTRRPAAKDAAITVVMPGLDPGTHSVRIEIVLPGCGMDCRVKPGNDDKRQNSAGVNLHPVE